jgi:hypothetical protein
MEWWSSGVVEEWSGGGMDLSLTKEKNSNEEKTQKIRLFISFSVNCNIYFV